MIIDHGRGIYSAIDGLYQPTVDIGNGVLKGAMIGRISKPNTKIQLSNNLQKTSRQASRSRFSDLNREQENTNLRRTSLHWQCLVTGTAVDPRLLLALT